MKKIFLITALAFLGTATFAGTLRATPVVKKQTVKVKNHKKGAASVENLSECGYSFWCGVTVSGPCGMSYSTLVWVQGIVCGGDGDCSC